MSRPANAHTPEEAQAKRCAFNAGNCLAVGCMAWLWAWTAEDGFETHEERSLDWDELGSDPDGLKQWLVVSLGDEAKAADLANRWAECPNDDYEAIEAMAEEINEALHEAFLLSVDGKPSKLDNFVEARRPEGDGWGTEGGDCGDGQMIVVYQRPAQRRGFCGRLKAD